MIVKQTGWHAHDVAARAGLRRVPTEPEGALGGAGRIQRRRAQPRLARQRAVLRVARISPPY